MVLLIIANMSLKIMRVLKNIIFFLIHIYLLITYWINNFHTLNLFEFYLFIDIPHLVFLTKTDEICELVEKDVSKIFTSSLVEDAVNKAADIIAIPRSHVLPVKNYEKETILNMDINILALMALRKSLMFADDFLENLYDWQLDNIQTLNKKDWAFKNMCLFLYVLT